MRRILVAGFLSLFALSAGAEEVLKSSHTLSNNTTKSITSTASVSGLLWGMLISNPGVSSEITFYDARDTTGTLGSGFGKIGPIATTSQGFIPFQVAFSSGITYTTSGTSPAGITILYKSAR